MPSSLPQGKLLALARQSAARLGPDYLGQNYFLMTLLAALLLHLAAIFLWALAPKTQVVEIPVHALNIKLGDGDQPDEIKSAPAPQAVETKSISAPSRMIREQPAEPPRALPTHSPDKAISTLNRTLATPSPSKAKVVGQFDRRQEGTSIAAPIMPVVEHQFVRETGAPAIGSADGSNNPKDADMVTRYTQTISLWINKFKIYPPEASEKGIKGDTVVRIRVDRQGNILYYILDHSTGSEILDRAAIEMTQRANPVPPMPSDFPSGETAEFLVPITFNLDK